MLAVYRACLQAESLLARQQPREAIQLLLPALPKSPESKKLRELLIAGYTDLGDFAAAEPHVRTCLEMEPADRAMWVNLGTVLLEKRQFAAAADVLARVVNMPRDVREPIVGPSRISRVDVEVQVKLAIACLYQQQLDRAREHYQRALHDVPDHVMANEGLAHVASLQGRHDEAIACLQRILKTAPDMDAIRKNLGALLCAEKRYEEGLQEWREGLRRKPGDPDFLLNLAWCLATCPEEKIRNGREAVTLAEQACQGAGGRNPAALDVLAAACAEAGDFGKAVETAKQALQMCVPPGAGAEQAQPIAGRLKLYSASKPYRQP